MAGPGGSVVIGIGNLMRGDDAAGPEVLGRLHGRVPAGTRLVLADGEPAALVEAWTGTGLAVVVDAVISSPQRPPGTLYRLDRDEISARGWPASSHALGLGDAVALADALGRLPGRLIVHAVEAGETGYRAGLSPAVAAVIGELTEAVLADLAEPAQPR